MRSAVSEIIANGGECGFADGHHALFYAFTENAQKALFGVECLQSQTAQFRDAQPAAIHQFEHCAVAQTVRRVCRRCFEERDCFLFS